MKVDAHYYAVLAFARACGFNKRSAGQVAFASQFVDDAKINHIVLKEKPAHGISYKDIDGKPSFFNMATCHSYTIMKTFNYSAMVGNTVAFHFVPGCEGMNFPKKLRCKEDSPVIRRILEDAAESGDLIKLGISLHAYADTFSHQGFSGLISKVNDIQKCKPSGSVPLTLSDVASKTVRWFTKDRFDRLFDSACPAYGHGQAMEYPDLPFLDWSYNYDYSDEFSEASKSSGNICNRERYTRAFKGIALYLTRFLMAHEKDLDTDGGDTDFYSLFQTLLRPGTNEQRIEAWKELIVKAGYYNEGEEDLEYREDRWLKRAFSDYDKKRFNGRKVEDAVLAPNFIESEWYRFYEGVHWYKDRFFKYCQAEGLDIPR
jgi:hypothetical protein